WCDPEYCEYVVEDEENVVFVCELANRFEVFFLRRNYSGAAHHGLGDYCCEVVRVPFQDSLKRDGIIPLCDNNGSRYSVRYSWIVRQFGGRLLETGDDRGRLDAEEDVIVVTMIVSFEFEDLVATSEGSCDANCLHCRPVPVLAKLTISAHGTADWIFLATSSSSSVVVPSIVPICSCRFIAWMPAGCELSR